MQEESLQSCAGTGDTHTITHFGADGQILKCILFCKRANASMGSANRLSHKVLAFFVFLERLMIVSVFAGSAWSSRPYRTTWRKSGFVFLL